MSMRTMVIHENPCPTCGHQPMARTVHLWRCDVCGAEQQEEHAGDEPPYEISLDGHANGRLVGPSVHACSLRCFRELVQQTVQDIDAGKFGPPKPE